MRTSTVLGFAIALGVGLLLSPDGSPEPPPAPVCAIARPPDAPGTVTAEIVALDEHGFPAALPATVDAARAGVVVPQSAWEELDDIYGLMALAVVHADWQEPRPQNEVRGYNIGGVIVDPTLEVVGWERNSNKAMCNGTQHGEVRTMLKHLNLTGERDLRGHQIYTSLEPCMMCSGMMMQQQLLRTVYMQTDDDYGKNLERLTIDTTTRPVCLAGAEVQKGYGPAPRAVISSVSPSEFRKELDVAWRDASQTTEALTGWLQTAQAEDVYRRARAKFEHYPLRFGDSRATVTFRPPGAPETTTLTATKTNAELYAAALRLFDDPASGIVPYVRASAGGSALVEATDNVHATLLLAAPEDMVGDGQDPGDVAPSQAANATVLEVEGTVNGRHVHQKRVRHHHCR